VASSVKYFADQISNRRRKRGRRKMAEKIPESEYTKTNSIYSSMRLAFFWVVKYWIILGAFIVLAVVGAAFVNGLRPKDANQINIPIGPIGAMYAGIGAIAFGGKVAQSFSEPNDPPTTK
jgi:hypothetical protein